MIIPKRKPKAAQQRESIRNEFWPTEDAWIGGQEVGWFRAPRTLPLILNLLGLEEIRGKTDPTGVYLELWSRDFGEGVITMASQEEHAFAAGYVGSRGVRSWQERMKLLEELGFIKTKQVGNQRYKYVLLVHPTTAIEGLREQKKIPQIWWDTYRARQIEVKEASYTERQKAKAPTNVVPINRPKGASVKATQKKSQSA